MFRQAIESHDRKTIERLLRERRHLSKFTRDIVLGRVSKACLTLMSKLTKYKWLLYVLMDTDFVATFENVSNGVWATRDKQVALYPTLLRKPSSGWPLLLVSDST